MSLTTYSLYYMKPTSDAICVHFIINHQFLTVDQNFIEITKK